MYSSACSSGSAINNHCDLKSQPNINNITSENHFLRWGLIAGNVSLICDWFSCLIWSLKLVPQTIHTSCQTQEPVCRVWQKSKRFRVQRHFHRCASRAVRGKRPFFSTVKYLKTLEKKSCMQHRNSSLYRKQFTNDTCMCM